MRPAKYRGLTHSWDEKNKCNTKPFWAYGYYSYDGSHHWIMNPVKGERRASIVDPETVGQFTGLYDKNDKEIYESDILQIISPDLTTEHLLGQVIWDFMSWQINDGGMLDSFKTFDLEIIDNIYENPELLEANNESS